VLGQHTADVLRECGVADTEIEALAARGAVEIPGAADARG
jgi:crotonobetainyl-CoA:carnitine CoA-transferase CaiB-like acyl-CoA transferase